MSLLALVGTTLPGFAAAPAEGDWRIWLEPKFMRQKVSAPIRAAQKTELAAGVLSEGDLQPISKNAFDGLGGKWEEFAARARANAAADLAILKPNFSRNRRKIIEYAELHSEKPIVASAVLAPGFLPMFAETIGPAVLLVVPNRNTAYVFPKLASNYRDYAPMVLRAYRETSYPVSVEVFEVSADGIKAIGAYADPARD